jgi:hypothetical protein
MTRGVIKQPNSQQLRRWLIQRRLWNFLHHPALTPPRHRSRSTILEKFPSPFRLPGSEQVYKLRLLLPLHHHRANPQIKNPISVQNNLSLQISQSASENGRLGVRVRTRSWWTCRGSGPVTSRCRWRTSGCSWSAAITGWITYILHTLVSF